jgi:hypothetical protein
MSHALALDAKMLGPGRKEKAKQRKIEREKKKREKKQAAMPPVNDDHDLSDSANENDSDEDVYDNGQDWVEREHQEIYREDTFNRKIKDPTSVVAGELLEIMKNVSSKEHKKKSVEAYMKDLNKMTYYDHLNHVEPILSELKTITRELSISPHIRGDQKNQTLAILSDLNWIRADLFKLVLQVQYNQPTSHPKHQQSNDDEELQKVIAMSYEKRTYPEFPQKVSRVCSHLLAQIDNEKSLKIFRDHLLQIQQQIINDKAWNPEQSLEEIAKALEKITQQNNRTQDLQDIINQVTTLRVELLDKNMKYLKGDMRVDCRSVRDSSNLQIESTRNDINNLLRRMTTCTDQIRGVEDTLVTLDSIQEMHSDAIENLQEKAKSKSKWRKRFGLGADASALPALLEQL